MTDSKRLLEKIEKMTTIGRALSLEKNYEKVLELILDGAQSLTDADAGTLYLYKAPHQLSMELVRTTSLGIAMGGVEKPSVSFSAIHLHDSAGNPRQDLVVAYAVNNLVSVRIDDAYTEANYDFSGTKAFDVSTGYRSCSFLTIPLTNHDNEIIGALQLINPIDAETGESRYFNDSDQRLAESLASQAAILLANKQLTAEVKRLFDAFVRLMADAIDDKSPYTGGHCKRVPVLTMMLADAAHETSEGPLKDFFMSPEDREELDLAGWLHDCGKVTTPEAVMDKATKLETIFDRIHLVKGRYEILLRDERLKKLEQWIKDKGENIDGILGEEYLDMVGNMKEEIAFLEKNNLGGEFMDKKSQQRIEALSKRTWMDMDGIEQPLITGNEVYNLNIPKGTLTTEEREVINDHIVMTIKMLETLPFPKHLQNVPEFAGGHHERMDGKGYPKGLKRHEMSVQARIMAIADIFEALTASDRPYKKAMPLSKALGILSKMKQTNHIDPDLFDLFIEKKVYMSYAHEFLSSEQIDSVDLTEILA